MATFTFQIGNAGNAQIEWTGFTANESGAAALCGQYPDKTVQVDGTFDTATVVIEGSNDGANWFTLNDPQGNALSFTAAGMEAILESPRFIRATVSSVGAGTDVNVRINAVARN